MLLKRMEQIHAKNAVRHAEKRRVGTCQFANRIAKLSLQCYQSSVPASHRNANKQTCVAAIVAHFSNSEEGITSVGQHRVLGLGVGTKSLDAYNSVVPKSNRDAMKQTCVATIVAHYSNKYNNNNNQSEKQKKNVVVGKLRVLGLGVGTKFVSHDVITDEQTNNNENNHSYGKRIRDCHAEVLARRAFRRQLALEILSDLKNESPSTGEGEASNDRDDFSILERSKCTDGNQQHICYRLKSNVTLHFYASSAPCGNATLKKFVKIEKEIFDPSLVCCILVQVLAGVYVLTRVNFF